MLKNSFISSFENNGRYNLKRIHVVTFIVIFTFSFICCEGFNRFFVRNQSINFVTLKYFEAKKKDIEIIFLGDSHFIRGVDVNYFVPVSFNLSFPGVSYLESYFLLKFYIHWLPSLKVVVLPLDLHSFSSYRADRIEEPIFWNRFIDYPELIDIKGLGILKNKFTITFLAESTGRKLFVRNLRDFILQLGRRKQKSLKTLYEKTIKDLINTNPFFDRQRTRKRVELHFYNNNVFDPDLIFYFERILKLCSENNVSVLILQTPVSKDYREFACGYIEKGAIIQKILKNPKYKDYIYRNFDYLEIYSDKDKYFTSDGDHLNVEGREVFSKLFSQEITKIASEITRE